MRLGPAEAEADAQATHLRRGVHGARVFGDVQTGDADLAGDAGDLHQRVEYGGRGLVLGAFVTMTTGLEAHAVDGAVDFRLAQQRGDLLVQRRVQRQVGDLEALRLGVRQTCRVEVTDDDHGSAEQTRRSSSGQTDRAGTGDVDGGARADPSGNGAVVAGGQNVGQAGQVTDLLHGLVAIRQLEQVEVGVGHQHVFSLATGPVAHVDVAVGAAGTRRVDGQAHAGVLLLAAAAATAGDVEGHGNQVTDLQTLDVAALLDHLAGDLVTQHQTDLSGGATAHHVLVGAADVGGNDFEDDPVLDLLAARVLHFRVVDLLHLDLARAEVNHTTIIRHA